MSAELIAILAIGAGMVTTFLIFAGLMLALINQLNKESRQRTDRIEDQMNRGFEQLRTEMNRGFEQLRSEMNQGFSQQDARIRGLEQGQAYMSGQFSELKDYFVHRPPAGNNPETGD